MRNCYCWQICSVNLGKIVSYISKEKQLSRTHLPHAHESPLLVTPAWLFEIKSLPHHDPRNTLIQVLKTRDAREFPINQPGREEYVTQNKVSNGCILDKRSVCFGWRFCYRAGIGNHGLWISRKEPSPSTHSHGVQHTTMSNE
ncbi:PREDICTED: uncharacterized protein LOC106294826 [Brassica oleracea var. oleracea]|uniref:uncharacterized protein LOC106294826 n=1 Tax=Brassica oleracea var. oleracea TaxID=109376 RepID=UPI0006A6ED87|nr:PREDICTED: uncharacterized protein LOC106294826 [Brassica oleracea var. oleracea]